MGDDFDEIMSTEKFIEPTAKLGVLVLCLVPWTRLRQGELYDVELPARITVRALCFFVGQCGLLLLAD